MAKFKNIVTGNVLEVTDPLTVTLMTASDRYEVAEDAVAEAAENTDEPVVKKSAKAKSAAES